MIEVVHFQNRWGKQMVGVLSPDINSMASTPAGVEYAQRYAAGLEPAFYRLPAIPLQVVWPDVSTRGLHHD